MVRIPRPALFSNADAVVAWILLINASLGLAVWVIRSVFAAAPPTVPWACLLGVASGIACLRGRALGLWGALLFYALQVVIYHPLTQGVPWGVKAGVSLAGVYVLAGGILIVNYVALVLLAASAVLLYRATPAVPAGPTP